MAGRSAARRSLLAVVTLGGAAFLALAPASLAAATQVDSGGSPATVTVGDSSEAYYVTGSPADPCGSPVGCPPATVSNVFAPNTLHVGEAGGNETFRTYVSPDLSSLPPGATPVAGTMTLPVATDPQSGTAAPGEAGMRACLALGPAPDGTAGSASPPPPVDTRVCVPATYHAASGTFTVPLASFLAAWSAGRAVDGIALTPAATQGTPAGTWQVAFNGRGRAGYPHIHSVISYLLTPATGATFGAAGLSGGATSGPASGGGGFVPAGPPPAAGLPGLSGAGTMLPVSGGQAPQVAVPLAGSPPPPGRLPAVALSSREFRYPTVFFMPLALLVGGVFLVRLFTRDPLAGRRP